MSEVQQLRDRVEELEGLLGMRTEYPRAWGLSGREGRIFGLLMNRVLCSPEYIFAAIWGYDSERTQKAVEVYICRIRRKVAPLGLIIRNCRGSGYYLDAAMKCRARELLASFDREAA